MMMMVMMIMTTMMIMMMIMMMMTMMMMIMKMITKMTTVSFCVRASRKTESLYRGSFACSEHRKEIASVGSRVVFGFFQHKDHLEEPRAIFAAICSTPLE